MNDNKTLIVVFDNPLSDGAYQRLRDTMAGSMQMRTLILEDRVEAILYKNGDEVKLLYKRQDHTAQALPLVETACVNSDRYKTLATISTVLGTAALILSVLRWLL